ncbi:gamma-glutamyltransferase [Ignavibacterium album]|uniref:gamma-glutamyltransferase n=1 Tax=Ignavibacterium album TaxID=591197 RepID=UPI0026F17142|nr:gamma-glutamyltransferase [Ignavibacterium album]
MRTYSEFLFFLFIVFNLILFAESPEAVRGKNGMVVSASRLASEVGIEILKKGGNAVDAAVAVGFTLAVTYPAAGNIGGGGFMVIRFNDGKSTAIDYREKAPLNSYEKMFQDSAGNFLPALSQEGTTSAGVPGSVAGLIYALEKYGTMKLSDILQPAVKLAEEGFILDYQLAQSINFYYQDFLKYPSSKKIFTNNDRPFNEGDLFVQKDLAHTLKLIAENGRDGFYKGEVAERLVAQVQSLGGILTQEDLDNYFPVERLPLVGTYRGYEIITMGPPSAGGITLLQTLNILENKTFSRDDWGSSNYIHTITEALKYSFADRSKYLGDPDFYPVPVDKLISKSYARELFQRISDSAVPSIEINPGRYLSFEESKETTHYSVIDKEGNAVSTTTTLNSSFGSRIVVEGAGFLLNNEMDDFSSKPGEPNQFGLIGSEANRIQPGKRMLSSMTPTIITKNEKPVLILGSPGGSTIPTVVLQVILNYLDFGMDIQQAVNAPRFHHQWLPDQIDFEEFGIVKDVMENLIAKGQCIGDKKILGRVEAVAIENNLYLGATDPRGSGAAVGY